MATKMRFAAFSMGVAASVVFLASRPADAHHSFAAEFDRTQPVILEGTVAKIEWQNPHTRIYLYVKGSAGDVESWELELSSPNNLLRAGWSRNSVQLGDSITVKGFRAKDGSKLANASQITAGGKVILSEITRADAKP